jgi:hypothetical protein
MNITPENVDSYAHKEWLAQGSTQQLLKRLNEFRERFIVSASSGLYHADTPDRVIYSNLACVRSIDTIVKLINDTDTFLDKPQTKQLNQTE